MCIHSLKLSFDFEKATIQLCNTICWWREKAFFDVCVRIVISQSVKCTVLFIFNDPNCFHFILHKNCCHSLAQRWIYTLLVSIYSGKNIVKACFCARVDWFSKCFLFFLFISTLDFFFIYKSNLNWIFLYIFFCVAAGGCNYYCINVRCPILYEKSLIVFDIL